MECVWGRQTRLVQGVWALVAAHRHDYRMQDWFRGRGRRAAGCPSEPLHGSSTCLRHRGAWQTIFSS